MSSRYQEAENRNIFHVAESVIGLKRAYGNNANARYFYPGLEHKTPSLVANASRNNMHSFRETIGINGGQTVGPVHLVMHFNGCSMDEAIDAILGNSSVDIQTKVEEEEKSERPPLHPGTVNRPWNKLKRALPYLESRGITEKYANMQRLGYWTGFKMRGQSTLYLPEGEVTLPKYGVNRHTIPVYRTLPEWKIQMVSLRRDEEDAKQRLELVNKEHLDLAQRYASLKIEKGSKDSEESIILETLFGAKYLSLRTSNYVYQWWNFVRWNGKKFFRVEQPFGLIMEGQYDAILPFLHYGLPSASVGNSSRDISGYFTNTEHLYIVQDNDQYITDPATGEIYSPGEQLAHKMVKRAKRTLGKNATIIKPYSGCKDLTDMYQAGVLRDWLVENNLVQSNKERIAS